MECTWSVHFYLNYTIVALQEGAERQMGVHVHSLDLQMQDGHSGKPENVPLLLQTAAFFSALRQ